MKLKDAELLAAYMHKGGWSQARLGRYAGCSRQFIWALLNGEKDTCTDSVGTRIEEALGVLPSTLFARRESPVTRHATASQRTAPAA